MPVPSARSVAATVLERVERDEAFAAAALEAELARAVQLEARDRSLATELVYGSLRVAPWLDREVARYATRGTKGLDLRTRVELRLAAYQLFFLERVPAFAAVSEGVDAVRRARGDKLAAFANAVLRKVAKEAEGARGREREARLDEAILASAAPWLSRALERALGEGARAFILSGRTPSPLGLRIERPEEREAWLARLAVAAPEAAFERGRVSPHAILARGAGRPEALPGWSEGAWTVQEEGSQLVALAVGAREGETILDACAGRGNKASLLARAVGARGAVDVADLHPSKLDTLRAGLARLGLAPRAAYAVDWTRGAGDCAATYDRVLVDAPCSGIGTLRRRPDLATRRRAEDLPLLGALQLGIATRVTERLKPGGRLIYAVCSVLREEAEQVVESLLRDAPALEPAPFDAEAARAIAADEPTLRILPHVHGTDGYFVASLRKKC